MTYQETLDYLFNALPMFQRIGAAAFKKDLSNTVALCDHLGNPQNQFKSIHVAGTNGKGSTSHAICSVLMEAGYKVGLYTSPHLKSFTERIKINGVEIPDKEVVNFVSNNKIFIEELKPSFFEMTVGMAFWFFAKEQVDAAVIEVGMGGRLDSTNIIQPEISIITNIGMDHMEFLGDTLDKIAFEKAGIIKPNIPVIISQKQKETTPVFITQCDSHQAPIFFAEETYSVKKTSVNENGKSIFEVTNNEIIDTIELDLNGNYQANNLPGILKSIEILVSKGWKIENIHLDSGLSNIVKNTGLKGRWQVLSNNPLTICDTGHNEDGIRFIVNQLEQIQFKNLYMVIGMVKDKDITKVLSLLPKNANYVFCEAKIPRAMPAAHLYQEALKFELNGVIIKDVNDAIDYVRKIAAKEDLIFIGGSTFVVAEIKDL
ncbi:bifunctional folylpolyglutamate synthase/dihydrofolate synthase [Aquiflexum lacus]|uniref:bifunctional folylpolyglutamate synthase/dihydrofolate synthase n=1 Tax=Aquiflexum lacus TaxID=2483805 RepID=UPI0018937F07|nr:folylpolyglutamate synthase/dihydrofolate synthase family protein [Aquiflexum lacus]